MSRKRVAQPRERQHERRNSPIIPLWIGLVACGAVAGLALVFGLHKLDDFDTWWHLAAGRWIATHHAIPSTDTLSHTVRDHAWINLQWGFDLILYGLHSLIGPAGLTIAGAVVFAVTAVMLMRIITVNLSLPLASLVVLLALLTAQERVTLRPELASFLLLAAVLLVLEHGRRRDERAWMLLVPLMMVWANIHSLFVIGAFAIICAMVGQMTLPPRRLLLWGGLALASVVINPFGVKGVLFPLTLLSRIDGSNAVFQTVGEFASPFDATSVGVSVTAYKVMLVVGSVGILGALATDFKRLNWGGLLFVVGLAALSSSARRNIALFAIGATPFIGQCLGAVVNARPRLKLWVNAGSGLVAGAVSLTAVAVGGTVVSGAFYRYDNSPQEFGAAVIEGAFPERAAAFAKAAQLPGKLYNDMASGGYLTWSDPIGDGVFIDGRLEVYDTAFITDFVTAQTTPARWQANADRFGVQTAIVFHRFEPDRVLIGRLAQDKTWSLVYIDEVAAIFVRTEGNAAAIARANAIRPEWDARTDAWLNRPITSSWHYPSGRVEGTRAYARALATVGRAEPAIATYLKLVELGIPASEEIDRRLMLARYFSGRGRVTEAQEQARKVLALDPQNAEALKLR